MIHESSFSLSAQMKQHVQDMFVKLLFVRHGRVDVRKVAYFFGNRVVKIWNSLPAAVDDFCSLQKFKCSIERVGLSRYVNF